MIRLWINIPAVQKRFECKIPLSVSFQECIPYLNRLLEHHLDGDYQIPDDAWFLEESSGNRISVQVTLSRQNLRNGMSITIV